MYVERGKRIAFDYGEKRIGVALADADGLVAVPLTTLQNDQSLTEQLFELFADYAPVIIYIGSPKNLSGAGSVSEDKARAFGKFIADEFEIPVHMIDERLSTVSASSQLKSAGKSPSRSRDIIDQIAATNILESALQYEKKSGSYAGQPLNSNS